MNLPGDPPVIAIIGAGEMGTAVGRHLQEAGARVLISLNGRSAASADRVRRAGLEGIDDDQRLTDGIILRLGERRSFKVAKPTSRYASRVF
jgi:3-hydroxyisobutyrate dehydrogenase-like beta-hydroxyacid dehydrogenase